MANECASCHLDFGSVAAFDAHRVGVHEYTFNEGLRFDPPREDGRRCLGIDELETLTDKGGSFLFGLNSRCQWSLSSSLDWGREARSVRECSSEGPSSE